MLSKSEKRKLAAKEREWGKISSETNASWTKFWKEVKKLIRQEKDKMMYGRKSKDKIDRFAYELFWWLKLIVVFLAYSYVMGFGR